MYLSGSFGIINITLPTRFEPKVPKNRNRSVADMRMKQVGSSDWKGGEGISFFGDYDFAGLVFVYQATCFTKLDIIFLWDF